MQSFSFCVVHYVHYDHINSNQLKATLGRRDKFKYTDHLSAEIKPQHKRLNYFPKLNSVVKYANTGSKYSKLSAKQYFSLCWFQHNDAFLLSCTCGICAFQTLWRCNHTCNLHKLCCRVSVDKCYTMCNTSLPSGAMQSCPVQLRDWIRRTCITAGMIHQIFDTQLGDSACSTCLAVRVSSGWSCLLLAAVSVFTDCCVLDVARTELEKAS